MSMPDFQRANVKEIFAIYDAEKKNQISKEKLRPLMRSLGVKLMENEVREILIDLGNPDVLEFETVVSLIIKYGESFLDLDEYRLAFNLLDRSNSGFVMAMDVVKTYDLAGQRVEIQQAEQLVKSVSLFGRNRFNLQELIVYLMRK